MFAIKSKRTGRFYSEQLNDWLNSSFGCTYTSVDEANDVAEMFCDRGSYVLVSV